jgi:hypothetical protein
MLKVIALVVAAVFACTAIGTWAVANSRDHSKPVARITPINPIELMKAAPPNLPHVQYDAH